MTCRELYGRDKTVKLFEGLRRGGLEESISATFRTSLLVLEDAWLKKVRESPKWSDVIITADEDAPVLEKAEFPKTLHAGESVRLRLFLRDKNRDLLPSGVYMIQHDTGAVSSATPGTGYQTIELRIEKDRRPGTYGYTLTAIDEAGNVRNWEGNYSVEP